MTMTEDGSAKKGVVVEFDFAAAPGADILYATTERLMKENDVPFSPRIEAQHLAGGNYQGGLAEYFASVKSKKLPSKVAKDLSAAFREAMTEAFPSAVTDDFKAFISKLLSKGVKVVIATRADMGVVKETLNDFLDDCNLALYEEISSTYGSVKWDIWRRAAATNHLRSYTTIAVAGSGFSVKSALLAGMGAVAVANPRVEYQDFGGANEIFDKLDGAAASAILRIFNV